MSPQLNSTPHNLQRTLIHRFSLTFYPESQPVNLAIPEFWGVHEGAKSGTSRNVRISGLPTGAKISLARSLHYEKSLDYRGARLA